jgi:hypothetical protein
MDGYTQSMVTTERLGSKTSHRGKEKQKGEHYNKEKED